MALGGNGPMKASTVPYFYGRITRDEAEEILNDHFCEEGMFLLRESISPLGNYAISLCHDKKVHHYSIEKQTDGTYMIPAGKKFLGPIELIVHHQQSQDGVITLLRKACNRPDHMAPVAFRGMTYSDLESELIRKADSIKGVDKQKALGTQREHLVVIVSRDLHLKQPWYHGKIDRNDSEKRLRSSGHKDGKFLVRMREDKKTFAICISFKSETRHYKIDKDENKKFGIQDGPKFDCIMMLIDHYHNKQDGLLCKLTEPVACPGYDKEQLKKYMEFNRQNMDYFRLPGKPKVTRNPSSASNSSQGEQRPPLPPLTKRESLNRPTAGAVGGQAGAQVGGKQRALPPTPDESSRWFAAGDWEGDSHRGATAGFDSRRVALKDLGMNPEDLEGIYGSLPRKLEDFELRRDQIDLQDQLGAGQFGSVCRGTCKKNGKTIPVAVKTLKQEDVTPHQEPELLKEARIMMPLSHKNIVRMIGVCKSGCLMLVLELAPLGCLNTFLSAHKNFPQADIVLLLHQVAMGMEYLESMKFVHRDLAARNVLLVTETFAKISDFGMSKALQRDNNYYEAKEAGKWPLKWYAPECVYYWKFDSKSDVWSYGVTMWEATSYGDKPYKGKRGQEILKFLVEEEKRMEKPPLCDEDVYNVMLSCWEYDKNNRPDFKELAVILKSIIGNRRRSLRRPAERLIQDSDEMLERSSIPTT
ncbi:tyrosine-protein kinase SYK-like isoform X2 [Dreissena polymorpha]|uniref:tyrosine-protein kinase SYK-like isoform X2 n=1 Tax=Dreissena polymorpha TaxID=45954 RepID=UPI00226487E9|nr:tyrosine-protein kinase SYK-like isoform X2 [Dreissena polymorpha]